MNPVPTNPVPMNQVWSAQQGSGPLVVLIHGAMDRSSGMARTARKLSDTATVVTYDRRGYGRSVALAPPFGLDAHVDDLEGLVAGRQCVLFGHSYGGHVGLGFAARWPSLVRALMMYESPRSWESWWYAGRSSWTFDPADPEAAAERFLAGMIGRERWSRLPERTRAERRREGVALVSELSELRLRQPVDPDLIGCEVLVGVGSDSSQHQHQGTDAFVAEMRNASKITVDGANHGAHLTHPSELAAHLRTLVARNW
jgi:pimeloyl-ACP methyl ester carboxylesterase